MQRENPSFCYVLDGDFDRIMTCGLRKGALLEMISEYKFLSRRDYAEVFAELLRGALKKYGDKAIRYIIVPLPTIRRHIRERGFDHIKLICEELVVRVGLDVRPVLLRKNKAVQVGADAETRKRQADEAYGIDFIEMERVIFEYGSARNADGEDVDVMRDNNTKRVEFLLLDDVWTTGASMRAARDVLYQELVRRGLELEIKISAICLAKSGGYEF
jgi:predicted amidophosphoribosyltransferase